MTSPYRFRQVKATGETLRFLRTRAFGAAKVLRELLGEDKTHTPST